MKIASRVETTGSTEAMAGRVRHGHLFHAGSCGARSAAALVEASSRPR